MAYRDRPGDPGDLTIEQPGEYIARIRHPAVSVAPVNPSKPRRKDVRVRRREAETRLAKGEAVFVHDDLAEELTGEKPFPHPPGRPSLREEVKSEAKAWKGTIHRTKSGVGPWVALIFRLPQIQRWVELALKYGKKSPGTPPPHVRRVIFDAIIEARRGGTPLPKEPKSYHVSGLDPLGRTDLGWVIGRVVEELLRGGFGRDRAVSEQITDRIVRAAFAKRNTPGWQILDGLPKNGKEPLRSLLRPHSKRKRGKKVRSPKSSGSGSRTQAP